MNIIGISAFFHDSACCLLTDGVLKAAAEEERFTRIKADPGIPRHAFRYCLEAGGLDIADIDCIAYYEDPRKKLARQVWSGLVDDTGRLPERLRPDRPEYQIRTILGFEGPVEFVDHHLSHAASCFYFSGFRESAILTVDGVGEWATTTYGKGGDGRIELFEEVRFPHSLGLLYSTITSYLGFGVNDGEYKVMGLAPYGQPLYADTIRQLIIEGAGGGYQLNMPYFSYVSERSMYSEEFCRLFGRPPRKESEEIGQFHSDVARSMQVVLEEVLLRKSKYLFERTGSENLCMAGGVALNCVANGRILREGPFKKLFVQPAANDAGGALGAAAVAHHRCTGEALPIKALPHVYLGPAYSSADIAALLESTSLSYKDHRGRTGELLSATAKRLSQQKVIGWFQGRMEFGPRSLGARSILADPRNPAMRDRINAMVKKREGFRPFAPAVVSHMAAAHFELDHPSPFMLETCQVSSALDLPAITHVDRSARVQTVDRPANPMFFDLLLAFNRVTGCPILLNTSFNIKGEPIVCSPEDALKCFIGTDIDCLVIGDFIIDREDNDLDLLRLILATESVTDGIARDVYTFM